MVNCVTNCVQTSLQYSCTIVIINKLIPARGAFANRQRIVLVRCNVCGRVGIVAFTVVPVVKVSEAGRHCDEAKRHDILVRAGVQLKVGYPKKACRV